MPAFQKTFLWKKGLDLSRKILDSPSVRGIHREEIEKTLIKSLISLATGLQKSEEKYFSETDDNLFKLMPLLEICNETQITQEVEKFMKEAADFLKSRKKILVLTANFGFGHLTAASSIKEGLENLYGYDYDIEIIDFVSAFESPVIKTSKKIHEKTVQFTPKLYKLLFENTDSNLAFKIINYLSRPFVEENIENLIMKKNPDIMVSTWGFWDFLIKKILEKNKKTVPLISIITDSITIHSMWTSAKADYYIVTNKDTADTMIKKHKIPQEKIRVFGFPIKLNHKTDKNILLEKLNLDKNKKNIVIIFTYAKKSHAADIIKKLDQIKESNFQFIIITGKNNNIKKALTALKLKHYAKILDWVANMHDYLSIADIVLTKAGGATVMECIAQQKPMIITQVIPGQEEGNAKFVKRHELGVVLSKKCANLKKAVNDIFKNYSFYQKNLEKEMRPNATFDIANFIVSLLS